MAQMNTSAGKRHEHPLLLKVAHFSGKNPVITESEFNELIEHTIKVTFACTAHDRAKPYVSEMNYQSFHDV